MFLLKIIQNVMTHHIQCPKKIKKYLNKVLNHADMSVKLKIQITQNPMKEPIFIPMIAPRYTPKMPIFNVMPKIYANVILRTSSLMTVRVKDLNPEPTP